MITSGDFALRSFDLPSLVLRRTITVSKFTKKTFAADNLEHRAIVERTATTNRLGKLKSCGKIHSVVLVEREN